MLQALHKRRSVLYRWALLALAETAVTTPWLIFFYSLNGDSEWVGALPGAWLLLAAYLTAALWEVGAPQNGRSGGRRLWAMAAGLAGVYAAAFLSLPAGLARSAFAPNLAMWTLPVAGYLWYMGAGSIVQGIEYSRYYERFTVQALTLMGAVLLLVISDTAKEPRILVMLYWSMLLLFGSGLTLLLVTRDRSLQAGQAKLGDAAHKSDQLSPVVTWVVVVLGAVTILASRSVAPEELARAIRTVLRLVEAPATWVGKVIGLILVRVIMVVFIVIQFFASFLTPLVQPAKQKAPQMGVQPPFPEEWLRSGDMLDLRPYLEMAALLAVLIALSIWVYRLPGKRGLAVGGDEEERINLGLWSGLMADLRDLLHKRPPSPVGPVAASTEPPLGPRDPRLLFRRLQEWGAARGRPRLPRETPQRYGAALAEQHPEAAAACASICAVYDQARYGAVPPAGGVVGAAAQALAGLIRIDAPKEP